MASLALAKSPGVLDAALSSPGVSKLSTVKGRTNAAAWLSDRMQVVYPGDGDILEFRLQGIGGDSAEDEKLLSAVVDAYQSASDQKKRDAKPDELTSDATLLQPPAVRRQRR